ncbi:hypothetical protein [Sphingomicrobium clamense]|uniref:Uncharacterized protein n=1 Tax=Sphingomicrobium clamense TaxID=2851013 RepID=A0ABS6V2G1_9SPHN|nr:hypothetical protein [Sphingomicrobium sp. B8]MBW0143749.1 hypothetical protein [Sphingomicrobium sp. B8]
MVRQALILGCTAAALAACGKVESEGDAEITVRSEQQDKMFELSPLYRNIALKRAITGVGMPCQRVEYSGYVGQYESLDQWTAMCDDGRQWAIFMGADDTAQVRYCEDVVETGLPPCEITRLDTREETVLEDSADG